MNKSYTTISKVQLKTTLTRQLKLVDENLELRKDIEFRDYRIQKLEEEIIEMQKLLHIQEHKIAHKTVNIYV